jgi:hypothetical protein
MYLTIMLKILFTTFISLTFSVCVEAGPTPHYPKLFFKYSRLYDGVCAGNNPVSKSWADEAKSKEGEFTAIWEKEAPTLFAQLFLDFNKGFNRSELTATLSVCPFAPSFSDPLVLNVAGFLKSYMETRPLYPDYAFVNLVFHELLHTWVVENFKKPSPLLDKYKAEMPSVRYHLHLMAIQILIYTKLKRPDMLQWLSIDYSNIGGAYARAWEIVNKEGYQAFISEI